MSSEERKKPGKIIEEINIWYEFETSKNTLTMLGILFVLISVLDMLPQYNEKTIGHGGEKNDRGS